MLLMSEILMISVLTIMFCLLNEFLFSVAWTVFIYVVFCCCFSCDALCNIQGQKLQADQSAIEADQSVTLLTANLIGHYLQH